VVGADAGGIQGTGGDLSVDDPGAHPENDEDVRPAPPELPPQDLGGYKQSILEMLRPGETVPGALRYRLPVLSVPAYWTSDHLLIGSIIIWKSGCVGLRGLLLDNTSWLSR